MDNIIYFMTGGMFTLTRDGAERYLTSALFQTTLHRAAMNGKVDVVVILLRNGASINEKDVSINSL
jgi:hypothetical protein